MIPEATIRKQLRNVKPLAATIILHNASQTMAKTTNPAYRANFIFLF